MRYRPLGRTGMLVSELCLGTMTFGSQGPEEASEAEQQREATELVKRSLEAGVNFIDTANVYSRGRSERLLGRALKELGVERERIVLTTKVRGGMGAGPNQAGLSRAHIVDQVHESLERLQTDYLDLYQIHGADPLTPLATTLAALNDLVREGTVRAIGASNLAAWQLAKALWISDVRGYQRFESLQAYYSVGGRDLEREVVPLLRDQELGLLVWSPLAGGILTGKYDRASLDAGDGRRGGFDFLPMRWERVWDTIEVMRAIGESHGVSVAQVALAWLLHQEVVTSVIIGATRMEQLESNLGSVDVALTDADLQRLDEVSALDPEYPGWMVARQAAARNLESTSREAAPPLDGDDDGS